MSVEQVALYVGIASGLIGILSVVSSSLLSASRWVIRARRSVAIVAVSVAVVLACGMLHRSGGNRFQPRKLNMSMPVTKATPRGELPGLLPALTLRGEKSLSASPLSVAWSPNGKRIACGTDLGDILVFDAELECIGKLAGVDSPTGTVSFSADGTQVISGHDDGMVRIWDLQGGSQIRAWKGHDGPVLSGDLSHDGLVFCTAGWDGNAVTWDLASGTAQSIKQLAEDAAGHFRAIDVSPDGSLALSALEDGSIRLWNPESSRELLKCRCYAAPADHVGFLNGSRHAISATRGGVLEVWNLEVGQRIAGGRAHLGEVTDLKVCPHGSRIVTIGDDRMIRSWDANLGELVN